MMVIFHQGLHSLLKQNLSSGKDLGNITFDPSIYIIDHPAGLENSTRPLVFTSASGCRASENFDISSEIHFFPLYANNICDAGQVPILRYFEA